MRTLCTMAVAGMLVVCMAGCLSPAGPDQTGGATGDGAGNTTAEAVTGALAGKDIDESTRMRVAQGQPLTLEDIKAIAGANVSDDLIIGQISSTRTVYRLGTAQIIDLKSAGVSEAVIDYMISTPTAFAQPQPAPVHDYYEDPAPFPPFFFFPPPFPPPFYRGHDHHGW